MIKLDDFADREGRGEPDIAPAVTAGDGLAAILNACTEIAVSLPIVSQRVFPGNLRLFRSEHLIRRLTATDIKVRIRMS